MAAQRRLERTFRELFGHSPAAVADAPGRVNLIGEHTDYNGGAVLPIATPQRTVAAVAPRPDDLVRAASANVDAREIHAYRLGDEQPGRGWVDYVQGVTRVLAEAGHPIAGFDLYLESSVPVGAGLSSSAALEVALLRALRQTFALTLDDVALALAGQRAEAAFVGARVGVMDQMAASLADARTLLLLDTRSLAYRAVPLPEAIELVVVDSGLPHRVAGGEYNRRRAECEQAAARLGVGFLCELGETDLERVAGLPDPLARRARHVVSENARVPAVVAALAAGDFDRVGGLLDASHASLRNDYEVSTPELDLLAELLRGEPGIYGARLTGAGFGGSVVAVAHAGTGAGAGRRAGEAYAARTGRGARVLVPLSSASSAGGTARPSRR